MREPVEIEQLVDAAVALDKASIGRLVSLFEDTRTAARQRRRRAIAALAAHPGRRRAGLIGVTGAPGSGKSTLVGALATHLVGGDPGLAVAVLAVDPSSHVSGGALLGDRTRVRLPPREVRLYFRSQASQRQLGGLGRATFQVCRALRHLFDVVFVETVGIGQSEVEIRVLGDVTLLVIPPLAGDHVQFMKAGIMEIPDVLAVHKIDQGEPAEATYRALTATLDMARPGAGAAPSIARTSVKTGAGVSELAVDLRARVDAARDEGAFFAKEAYFFERWVEAEFGHYGLRQLARLAPTPADFLSASGDFDAAQEALAAALGGGALGG